MKNDKEFYNILDECLERILTGGETVEQCLASYPEHATALEPLLQTALDTKETLEIAPRPEFKERVKYQILTELRDMEERKQRRFSLLGWQPQWATAVIAVLVLLMASGGTVAAAGNSMPDQPLYPVKLATERVRLALTPSELGKAEYYAELVDRRVNEIVNMADKGKLKHMEKATERMNNQLMAMAVLVGTEGSAPGVLTMPPAVPEASPALPEAAKEAPAVTAEPEEQRPGMMMAPPPPKAKGPEKMKPEITAAPAKPAPEKAPVLAPTPAAVPSPEDEVEEEDEDEDEVVVPFDSLPDAVKSAAARLLGSEGEMKAEKEIEDGVALYEVEVEKNGQAQSVELTENGDLIEYEAEIPAAQLPPAVLSAIKSKYPNATIREAESVQNLSFSPQRRR